MTHIKTVFFFYCTLHISSEVKYNIIFIGSSEHKNAFKISTAVKIVLHFFKSYFVNFRRCRRKRYRIWYEILTFNLKYKRVLFLFTFMLLVVFKILDRYVSRWILLKSLTNITVFVCKSYRNMTYTVFLWMFIINIS